MRTDRKVFRSLLLASVSFLAIAVWLNLASAVDARAAQTTHQKVLSTQRSGPTAAGYPKHKAHVTTHKAWPNKAAQAAHNQGQRALVQPVQPAVRYNAASNATCYSGCAPYDTTVTYSWSVPATSGQAQTTYYAPVARQAQVSAPQVAVPAGAAASQTLPPFAVSTSQWTCDNGCTPYPSAQTYTWAAPAPVGPSTAQTFGQLPASQVPKRKLTASARTGRAMLIRPRMNNTASGRTALAANTGGAFTPRTAYGWNVPASAGAVQGQAPFVQPTLPPAPPVLGPAPVAPPQTAAWCPGWPQWFEARHYSFGSWLSSILP